MRSKFFNLVLVLFFAFLLVGCHQQKNNYEELLNDYLDLITVEEKVKEKPKKVEAKQPKHKIGSIVFVSRDAEADLNGFKLFPQYKKYTYTVEAYDADTDVYTLRRLNLSLKLKEAFILAPDEKAHDPLNRKQF